MKKVLITYPDSIAGKLISKGFTAGFKSNGCYVLGKSLKDMTVDAIEKFKPDIVFGYDYGFLFSGQMDLIDYLLESKRNINLVHYFGDEPNSSYAFCSKNELYDEFCRIVAENEKVFTYIWDKSFLSQIPNSVHLPLAVNTKAYKAEESKSYDITFVGRPLTEKRQKILAALVRKFGKKLSIFSYEKHFLQSLDDMKEKQFLSDDELDIYKSAYCGFLTTEKELADIYFNSKVNLNMPIHGGSGMNYRVFEVLASGGFLLTESAKELEKHFIVSKELETYSNIEDLLDKTEFYLKHSDIAQKIALIGYADVYKRHNFTSRVRTILDDIKNK